MADPPVIVAPQPAISPGNYAAGALIASQAAIALGIIFPSWTAMQTGAVAGLVIGALGGVHMLLQWYVEARWPKAPPPPDVLRGS